jgi:anthranilate synthase component 1
LKKPAARKKTKDTTAPLRMPVVLSAPADLLTPVSAYLKVAAEHPGACLLESVAGTERTARFSIIAFEAEFRFIVEAGRGRLEGEAAPRLDGKLLKQPIAALEELLRLRRVKPVADLPDLCGGAIGYAGFDFIYLTEPKLKRLKKPAPPGYDLALSFYRKFLIFDHLHHEIAILVLPREGKNAEQARADAHGEAADIAAHLAGALPPQRLGGSAAPLQVKHATSKADYLRGVEACRDAIRAGDAYQIVLSQQFTVPVKAPPFAIYRALRRVNPSPYMYFLDLPEGAVVGASPEMLLRCNGGELETVPIAGTRPRGENDAEDDALAKQLLEDPKELAEHRMLVDLGRNDLGRVAKYGSVKVAELMKVERYSHVMHLVSRVKATLDPKRSALDALRSVFPAGTLSGAPKFRALEIIEELEPTRRGLYGGAILHLSPSGNLDSCIAIRTLVIKEGTAWGQVGAGIVYDSDPETEYNECLHKFGALRRAIELAGA